MKTSVIGIDLIKRFEGFSARIYMCPAGYPTIGYGHAVHEVEQFASGITEGVADRLLAADVRIAEEAVARLIRVALTQNQFDALVSFTFNLGAGRLQMSRLRTVVNRREFEVAAAEFGRWVYAKGRKLPGLLARRAAEAALYRNGG